MISRAEWTELSRQADRAQRLERRWAKEFKELYEEYTEKAIRQLEDRGRLTESDFDFEDLLMLQWYSVQREALRGARKLAALSLPKGKAPRSLLDLLKQWKEWRRRGKAMPRQRAIAKELKKDYLKRIQTAWQRYSEPFRSGKAGDQERAAEKIAEEAKKSYSYGKMVSTTETTRYYNQARREYYDQNEDVTHYLFISIRDHRTTKWCATRAGVVYEKDSAYLERETPPCHWNCRSEIAPLTPLNPAHQALISRYSIQRKNRRPAPLPTGWNK